LESLISQTPHLDSIKMLFLLIMENKGLSNSFMNELFNIAKQKMEKLSD